MNNKELEALIKDMQRTLDWYKGIQKEKPRKTKRVK